MRNTASLQNICNFLIELNQNRRIGSGSVTFKVIMQEISPWLLEF